MRRRNFLLHSGAALAVTVLGARTLQAAERSGRFEAARDLIAEEIAGKRMPGAVWLIAQGDEIKVEALGVSAIDGATPMRRDTIFRIASMSKAITATAVMMLIEEGKIALDASVERWLPELAQRKVLRRIDSPLDDTEPARRAITVHDLLAFTLGFGLLFDDKTPIQKEIDRLQLVNGPPVPMTPHAPDEWMRRFGTLPLMHQPGARWMYNTGSLLQGVLVRRVAGVDFDRFVEERILGPLGMRDTGFFVPATRLDRFAGCGLYTEPQSGKASRMDADGAQSAYASRPVFASGAAGLVSTVDDYLAFARMLLNGGLHKGRRLLSAQSVQAMTTNRLTSGQIAASDFFPHFFDTNGWGYGMSVVVKPDPVSPIPGRYGWFGGFGTSWFNDSGRGLVSVVMTQSTDFLFSGSLEAYWKAVYAGLAT